MTGIIHYHQLQPNQLLGEVIAYVEAKLPFFVGSHTFDKIMVKKKNENQHTSAFCVFMMKGQDKFTFMPEIAQKGNRKIDVAVIDNASDEIIFTIEAKILPTPPGSQNSPRAKTEYVFADKGNAGAAMQRFKEGVHGMDFEEKLLPENGILAYILEEEFSVWIDRINQWVLDASWNISEQLEKIYFETTGKLISRHTRGGLSLTLHHFWVKAPKR